MKHTPTCTPLMYACLHGHEYGVQRLVEQQHANVAFQGADGRDALFIALFRLQRLLKDHPHPLLSVHLTPSIRQAYCILHRFIHNYNQDITRHAMQCPLAIQFVHRMRQSALDHDPDPIPLNEDEVEEPYPSPLPPPTSH